MQKCIKFALIVCKIANTLQKGQINAKKMDGTNAQFGKIKKSTNVKEYEKCKTDSPLD